MDIIKQCYQKSVKLLKNNSTVHGTAAASTAKNAKEKGYLNIFARDAGICSLGMTASKKKELIKIAKRNLLTLAAFQTKMGQIPYSVNPSKGESWFYYLGSIDSTLWWLIAVDFYHKNSGDRMLYARLQPKIKKALHWLFCQDQNNCGLLEQGEASDWADDMPNNGIVLYTNALWCKVLELYGFHSAQRLALDGLNTLFLPHQAKPKKTLYLRNSHRKEQLNIIKSLVHKTPYYLHYIGYRQASDRCDVYGNLLAILFNLAPPKTTKNILRFLHSRKISRQYPVQALLPPIKERDRDWRDYLNGHEGDCNRPYYYHNGGVWPFIGGFWVMVLHKSGEIKEAKKELNRLSATNAANNWQFNEWFQGKTGQPMGMNGQSWNAGIFLLAYHYLNNDIII